MQPGYGDTDAEATTTAPLPRLAGSRLRVVDLSPHNFRGGRASSESLGTNAASSAGYSGASSNNELQYESISLLGAEADRRGGGVGVGSGLLPRLARLGRQVLERLGLGGGAGAEDDLTDFRGIGGGVGAGG
ncbi:hypothetical protein HK100_010039, partial [Physocladia obscura]